MIDGPVFTHPDLRIQFQVPTGYLMLNGTYAVTVSGSAGKAQFSGGRYEGSLDDYITRVFRQLIRGQAEIPVPRPQRTLINGMPAEFTTTHVRTNSGVIDATVVAYQWDEQHIYHFVMLTRGGTGIGPFAPMVNSLRKITQFEAAAIRPKVIHIVAVAPGDTIQSLANQMAYRDLQLDRFLTLNEFTANSPLVPGQKVKLIVYGAGGASFASPHGRSVRVNPVKSVCAAAEGLKAADRREDDRAQMSPYSIAVAPCTLVASMRKYLG